MESFIVINGAVSLFYAALALLMLFFGLRYLDTRTGRPWQDTIGKIREDPRATSLYYGLRWLGACLVVAAFIGG